MEVSKNLATPDLAQLRRSWALKTPGAKAIGCGGDLALEGSSRGAPPNSSVDSIDFYDCPCFFLGLSMVFHDISLYIISFQIVKWKPLNICVWIWNRSDILETTNQQFNMNATAEKQIILISSSSKSGGVFSVGVWQGISTRLELGWFFGSFHHGLINLLYCQE